MAYLHHSSQEYVDEKVQTETDARTAAINAAKAHLQSLIQSEASRASGQEAILQNAINNIQTFEVVIADTLPDPSKLCAKKIYFVPSANPKATNTKDEYICVKQSGTWKWEQIGSTAITIEYDTEPTDGSSKHVRSGGIYAWVKEEVRKLTSWITDRLAKKADKATTLAGYGITDAATKQEVDSLWPTLYGKAGKDPNAIPGHLASLTEYGDLEDSGIDRLDIARMYGNDLVVQPGGATTRVNASMLGYSNASSDTIKDRLDAKADRASLAPEYSATSSYSVGQFVFHEGNIYHCTTAIALPGEAWNPAHWSVAQKLDDFFTNSNSLLNGRLAYERNETGLKDRAFNALTFDGTEYNLSTALAAVTPTASGQPRDLLIVATATAATTISFTAGTIKGDKPTIDGSGTWLITLTEYASGVWYCRQIKMEDAA